MDYLSQIYLDVLTCTVISKDGIFRPDQKLVKSFYGSTTTEVVTQMVLYIEAMSSPANSFEWESVTFAMKNWLWHRSDPSNPFKTRFTYTSPQWRINIHVEDDSKWKTLAYLEPTLENVTNTKSWLHQLLKPLKRLLRL